MTTFLLALLTLTVLFIAIWAMFAPDDGEAIYYTRLVGAKGGKSKKVVETDDEVRVVEED